MKKWYPEYSTIVLANGEFPRNEIPLSILKNAKEIICCDGAADKLIKRNFSPTAIVGDMDSISKKTQKRFSSKIYINKSEDTNDLTKAIKWCVANNKKKVAILGATGGREDHTLGNIFLLLEYRKILTKAVMFSNTGAFLPIEKPTKFKSFSGQQISVFSLNKDLKITSKGLKYPINYGLNNLWQGTLNEATGRKFSITIPITDEGIIVFQGYK